MSETSSETVNITLQNDPTKMVTRVKLIGYMLPIKSVLIRSIKY